MFKISVWDFVFIATLIALSLFLISFYFNATALNTNYPDWIVHAFRVKSFEEFGLASWTHTWANGISLWKAYQFFPHAMTVGIMKIFNLEATQAMVAITIGSFVALRIFMYVLLRAVHFSPFTAFICSVISFDLAQYWGGVADYSLMLGFLFFPVMLFLWVKYYEGHIQYLFPYFLGLSFYLHPVLGYSMVGLWLTGIILSDRKIISLSHAVQFGIFLAASSLFWLPIVYKASFIYTSPVFANKYFLNLVISGYKYFGLSLFVLIAMAICAVRAFFPIEKKYRWTKVLFIFLAAYFVLVLLGLHFDLPKALAQLQFTRGVTMIGIGFIFVFAVVVEEALRVRSTAFKGVIMILLTLVVIEGLWFVSIYSPNPTKTDLPEVVTTFQKKYPEKNIKDARVWSSTIGQTSYYAPLDTRLPYSYMGHLEANQISPRISPLVLYQPYLDRVPLSNIARLNDYYKISGVKYVFFDEVSPFATTLLSSDKQIYKDLGQVRNGDSVYHAFEVPWETRNALSIDPKYAKELAPFPAKLELVDINDQIALDKYVKKYVQMLYQPENTSLAVTYPSHDSVLIKIPQTISSNIIYPNESFDVGWKAYFNGKPVAVAPTGPNFTKITLPSTQEAGTIFLKHDWPPTFYLSIYLILLIPMEILAFNLGKKYLFTKSSV